jgi:hypothetical protein
MGTEPLLKGAYWLTRNAQALDAFVGIGSEILAMISEICCLKLESDGYQDLALWDDQIPDDGNQATHFDTWYPLLELESRLTEWTCPAVTQEYISELAETYRYAALVCLFRKARQLFPQDTWHIELRIAQNVAALVGLLGAIPYQSMAEGGLLYPLFIAGGDTMDEVSLALVKTRMQGLLEHRGFAHVALAIEVLEELWRLKNEVRKRLTDVMSIG